MTISPKPRSLDDIRRLLGTLPGPASEAAAEAVLREPQLTKPPGSLGRLEELSVWLCAWQGRHPPRVERPAARIFAGNHGVVERGVSAYPAAVTRQMVANFRAGGAAINQLCRTFGVDLAVYPLALDQPSEDFTEGPALSEAEFVEAFTVGMTAAEGAGDVLCLGEMGIGNTTSAAALACALYGGDAADWTGPGTGVGGDALANKIAVVTEAVALHRPAATDPLDLLRRLGGRELVAIAGAVLTARMVRMPVLLDGFISTAAAAPLDVLHPGALAHCQIAHLSAEPGHRRLIDHLGRRPLLDLDLRLGEGTGAVLAVALCRAAAACHAGMATFAEAGVSEREED